MIEKNTRISELEEMIADLKKRWPAHSVPAALLQELDDLETELENEIRKLKPGNPDA